MKPKRSLPRMVHGDPKRLRQVLNNLVENAVKFTAEGSVTVERASSDARSTSFVVRDTGIGIAAETQTRIFTPYTPADETTVKNFGGSGLGLAISQLVELMGGRIEVHSVPGHGRYSHSVSGCLRSAQAHRFPKPSPHAGDSGDGQTILVVEDHPVSRTVAVRQLERHGFHVRVAASGHEALSARSEQRYDLVLMDCAPPGLDGYEVTRRFRSTEVGHTPVIAFTAQAVPGTERIVWSLAWTTICPSPTARKS